MDTQAYLRIKLVALNIASRGHDIRMSLTRQHDVPTSYYVMATTTLSEPNTPSPGHHTVRINKRLKCIFPAFQL